MVHLALGCWNDKKRKMWRKSLYSDEWREKSCNELLEETIVIIFAEMANFRKDAAECVTEIDKIMKRKCTTRKDVTAKWILRATGLDTETLDSIVAAGWIEIWHKITARNGINFYRCVQCFIPQLQSCLQGQATRICMCWPKRMERIFSDRDSFR